MTDKDSDKGYLDKLDEVDDNVRQRLDHQFGQLRGIAIIAAVVVALVVAGRWMFGG